MSGLVGTSHSKSKVIGRSKDTAKAWINYKGTATNSILDSFNVSSVTDNATGDYTVTWLHAFSDANYCVVSTCINLGWGGMAVTGGGPTATQFQVSTYHNNSTGTADSALTYLIAFGE